MGNDRGIPKTGIPFAVQMVREATKEAIRIAKESGAIVSFDPNLRPRLWNTLDEAKEQVLYGLKHCHILKILDNEIQWLTGA